MFVVLTVILIVAPFSISAIVLGTVFGTRFTTDAALAYRLSDFEGLKAVRYEFTSNNNQKLVGYRYFVDGVAPQAVVVIAHGFGGGGHNSYMDCANYFAQNGFVVFAYDATANDESDGKAVGGLPQGVIDLDYAIDYVKSLQEFCNLPILLFGHSWGGYSVSSVLNFHPEVKAVVSVAGFNAASDLMLAQGVQYAGRASAILMPYVNAVENAKFGKYAQATAMDGFANSTAKVMIVHGGQDTTVPQQYGYEIYLREYYNSDRFTFVYRGDRGHNDVYYSDQAINYIKQINEEFSSYFEGVTLTAELRAKYINEHLDREQWSNLIDSDLFGQIVEFYRSAL
ncbi:MAG: alpha/beta fold hydrolase [Clostridiales bacterium]|nr:alpha/beta fold hydrolase [Clostridiales bacterium]